jgi:hypothetical protein
MNLEELGHARDVAEQGSSRYGKTIGIVRGRRLNGAQHDARPLNGDDPLDGVIAHVRDTGWSLLVTYWDGLNPDARRLDALPDKVDGILVEEGSIPAPLLDRLAARVPVVIIGEAQEAPDAEAGRPRRLLGRRACARLIERVRSACPPSR